MPGRYVRQARERSEGEHEHLCAVGHRRVTVTARDLLALDSAVHGRRAWHKVPGTCATGRSRREAKLRRAVVRGFRVVIAGRTVRIRGRVRYGARWTLHAERLSARNCCRETEEE